MSDLRQNLGGPKIAIAITPNTADIAEKARVRGASPPMYSAVGARAAIGNQVQRFNGTINSRVIREIFGEAIG